MARSNFNRAAATVVAVVAVAVPTGVAAVSSTVDDGAANGLKRTATVKIVDGQANGQANGLGANGL